MTSPPRSPAGKHDSCGQSRPSLADPIQPLNTGDPRGACKGRSAEFHLQWSFFLATYLRKIRRRFGNLEDPQILCALAIGDIALADRARLDQDGLCRSAGHPQWGSSAMGLARITSMPRQTVRRRLEAMERLGWVCQTEDHRWHIARRPGGVPRSKDDPFDIDEVLADLARFFGRFADHPASGAGRKPAGTKRH
jgi:hypothetical protein